jgi:glycosyltransferase involved in cell wall biosynthesis
MKILFLDQSGKLGGAELSLLDVAYPYRGESLVGLFQAGPFDEALRKRGIPVQVLTHRLPQIRKESNLWQSLGSLGQLLPLVATVARLSRHYQVIYTNTPKAFIVGAIASRLSRRPLVYHLRDILSAEHFSQTNLRLLVSLANRTATRVIANSQATRDAFIAAGGNPAIATVVYNGFDPEYYRPQPEAVAQLRAELGLADKFVVGHFSRLSPWKGQHILIDALSHCPDHVVALLVGDALFGEDDYVTQLHQQVQRLGLQHRVKFLGFRSDIPALMGACDLVAHTSTTPEPFGRVIVEAMLCGTPVMAAAAGGAVELVDHGRTGWLCTPAAPEQLAEFINTRVSNPEMSRSMAQMAQAEAQQRFHLKTTNQQISDLLQQLKS